MRAKLMTENIASSDIYGAHRKEIRPFKDWIRRNALHNEGEFSISPRDIQKTRLDIDQDMEMLELSRNMLEQDAMINIRKNIYKIIHSITAFQA